MKLTKTTRELDGEILVTIKRQAIYLLEDSLAGNRIIAKRDFSGFRDGVADAFISWWGHCCDARRLTVAALWVAHSSNLSRSAAA